MYSEKTARMIPAWIILLLLSIVYLPVHAQDLYPVWADEFDGPVIDPSVWTFDAGPSNDNVHFYTDRADNASVSDGSLHLIVLKEPYNGYNYTAALIKTKHAMYWRYGRIEARIRLPGSRGFVPAFWMLPEDDNYGYWPYSGEIDIMEHPTNELNRIYGTVHTGAYNAFTGSGPRGGITTVPDAQSAYHVYAAEWTRDKIDFIVDGLTYFTFNRDGNGSLTWPFDSPFYLILCLQVGGGWVGEPDASTLFPAVMDVDYVRVYQKPEDMSVCGPDFVLPGGKDLTYTAPHIGGISYDWSLPNTAEIVTGQNADRISVNWGIFGGTVELGMIMDGSEQVIKYPVEVSDNLFKNSGFEKGVKYWNKSAGYPAQADFSLSANGPASGRNALAVNVTAPGTNTWDVQLSQTGLPLEPGMTYTVTFQARSATNSTINTAVINPSNFNLYAGTTFQLSDTWARYDFSFTVPLAVSASFNIDLGGHTGQYAFDDFILEIPGFVPENQAKNPDFSDGSMEWNLNTFFPAQASMSSGTGECVLQINNGGVNAWDIHAGQTGILLEQGKEYALSFDAHAASPRTIFAFAGKNADPWTVYGGQTLSLTTRRRPYSLTFVMQDPTDSQARFGFDLGASDADVTIDNVFLSTGTPPQAVSDRYLMQPGHFALMQNAPNPFNPETLIRFELQDRTAIRLEIFDMAGRLTETVLEGILDPGQHIVPWNGSGHSSGIYVCRLSSPSGMRMTKMILLK
ncbi:carbohydrate binding domain-containing protein [bacterium]|nr:carbohydrate binding domain-containing protein [bacterium]